MNFVRRAALLAVAAAPAWGQFALTLANGTPVGQAYGFGNVEPGAPLSASFSIQNISAAPAALNFLTVNGPGFAFASGSFPNLPASLGVQQSIDFTVVFQATGTGSYSASLESVGISVILSAIVPAEFTCQWVSPSAVQWCPAAPPDFGPVPVGQSPTIEVILLNQTPTSLTVPGAVVSGVGFSLSGPSPGGVTVKPAASIALNIQFSPSAAGIFTGTLAIGAQTFSLSGTGATPSFPQPQIALTLAQAASAQQGTVAVNLSAISQISGTGSVTLTFVPSVSLAGIPADPGIAFASGGQTATFGVFIGTTLGLFNTAAGLTTQPTLGFQTGTTAGTLTITVQLGNSSQQQSIAIAPQIVSVTAVQGVRSAASLEVDITGFDNTRTAGALSFTFYDASGNPIGAPIPASGSAAFTSYFQSSAGGTFELKAVFPVLGDSSQIAAFQAAVTNSAGTATTARTNF